MTWKSIHLFLADSANTDAFLQEVIYPILEIFRLRGKVECWFFIRYWEGGPHLRLRVKNMPPDAFDVLMKCLSQRFLNYLRCDHDLPSAYPEFMVFDRPNVDIEARKWLPQGTIREIPYQPEILRYGGTNALAISEHLFSLSSDLALKVISETTAGASRQSKGLLLTCVGLGAATSDLHDLVVFLCKMKRTWQAILGNISKLDAKAESVSLLQRRGYIDLILQLQIYGMAPEGHARAWWNMLQEAISRWRNLATDGLLVCPLTAQIVNDDRGLARAIAALLDSHVHMMNNRLGLTPTTEYLYAQMLTNAARSGG